MGKINQIAPSVYNRISAGEVIERPYSVVKECVENSLDGGATEITIYATNGGKNIRIVDNGTGMSREDVKLAFLPHCTSKLKEAEDLENIDTLGFRGEALASIASIAMITLTSTDCETQETTRIDIRGGEVTYVGDGTSVEGTDIRVENLFFNTPVREKFLKSARGEESEITNLVSRLVLTNPQIKFNYYLNDVQKIKCNGDGLEKSVYTVYGKATSDNVIPISGTRNNIEVSGYIGKTDFTKSNRTYQTVNLNGRYVVNETISMAIFKAYQPFLMKRSFPFYVLNITIPSTEVDVNVHPTKHDVRFSDTQLVFKSIYGIISSALSGEIEMIAKEGFLNYQKAKNETETETQNVTASTNSAPVEFRSTTPKQKQENFETPIQFPRSKELDSTFDRIVKGDFKAVEEAKKALKIENEIHQRQVADTFKTAETIQNKAPEIFKTPEIIENKTPITIVNPFEKTKETSGNEYPVSMFKKDNKEVQSNGFYLHDSEISEEIDYSNVRVIGVFNKTYIIVEWKDTLYLIDQHAGHERILFDKYILQYDKQEIMVQDLLAPYLFDVNPIEEDFLKKNISNLFVIGFKIEHFGENTYRITSVPADLVSINFSKFIGEIFSDLTRIDAIDSMELVREKIMQKACKNAVKAGDNLSNLEIRHIFKMLAKSNILTCPHGRPIIIKFSKTDVEKWFKRIV